MLLVRADKKTTEIIEGSGSAEELLKDIANIAEAVLGGWRMGTPSCGRYTRKYWKASFWWPGSGTRRQ